MTSEAVQWLEAEFDKCAEPGWSDNGEPAYLPPADLEEYGFIQPIFDLIDDHKDDCDWCHHDECKHCGDFLAHAPFSVAGGKFKVAWTSDDESDWLKFGIL